MLFQYIKGTETITVSILFRRLKNTFFKPSWDWQYSQLSQARGALKIAIPRLQQRPAWYGKRTTFFFAGGPSAVVCVCRRKCVVEKCPATRSPSGGACTDRLLSPCHHAPVSSLLPRNWLDGPWRRHSFKRRQHHEDAMAARTKRPNKRAFWTLPFGTIRQSFFLCRNLPEGRQKKNRKSEKIISFSYGRTIQWAFRSDRPDPVLGSFWQLRTHSMM